MFYIDYQPPVYYIQPEIVYEQPIYIQPQIEVIYDMPVFVPAYPTFEMRQTIQMPSGTTIIIDRTRERFYVEPEISY